MRESLESLKDKLDGLAAEYISMRDSNDGSYNEEQLLELLSLKNQIINLNRKINGIGKKNKQGRWQIQEE